METNNESLSKEETRKQKQKEYRHQHYLKNKDKILKQTREYRENNLAHIKAKAKEWREKNAETIKEKQKEWRDNNPDKIKEYSKRSNEKYRAEHGEELRQKAKERYDEKRDELNATRRKKYQNDEEYRNKILNKNREYYEEHKYQIMDQHKTYVAENFEEISKKKKEYVMSPAPYDVYYDQINTYHECRRDPKNPDLLQVKCTYSECGNWYNPTIQEVQSRIKAIDGRGHGDCNFYCSEECKRLCPVYGQRTLPKNFDPKRDYDREVQPELRAMVLARDNYTCQREGCNKSQKDFPDLVLHCHHKFPLNEDPVCSADIDNCITLCEECHRWIHMNVPGCSYAELRCSSK